MLGQMELPYLVFNEHKTKGSCRFCHVKTRDVVYPPEIVDDIHSPIFVCSACREVYWKVEELRKMFNRSIVENIIHISEKPVVPRRIQLDMTSLCPRWIVGDGALRVFVYFHDGETRFLSSRYMVRTSSYHDVTDLFQDLHLNIPELNETVLEAGINDGGERIHTIVVYECLKFRGLDIRGIENFVRVRALDKVFEVIGSKDNWRRIEPETTK